MKFKKFLFFLLFPLIIISCATKPILQPQDKYYRFKESLINYYGKYASWQEDSMYNYSVADDFKEKIADLKEDKMVPPLNPEDFKELSEEEINELKQARAVLMAIFSNPYWSYINNPEVSAAAQVYYDCWVEHEISSDWYNRNRCKKNFYQVVEYLMQNIAAEQNFVEYASTVNSIFFKINSDEIKESSIPRMNILINQLRKVTDVKVVLYGYTDRTGTKKYNKDLAKSRVAAVYKVLSDSGVLENSDITITSKSFGENDPLISPQTVLNNPHSRRVDVFIISKE